MGSRYMKNEELGEIFRAKRQYLACNLQVVSWRTGLSESTISKAERGIMTDRTRAALLTFYDYPIHPKQLLGNRNQKS